MQNSNPHLRIIQEIISNVSNKKQNVSITKSLGLQGNSIEIIPETKVLFFFFLFCIRYRKLCDKKEIKSIKIVTNLFFFLTLQVKFLS